jgi:hypothetical protein
MLVNIYVLWLILKGKITSIRSPKETGLNRSRPVHMDRSFSGLDSQKSKDWTGKKTGPRSWSGPVSVFDWSQDWTYKH